MAPEPDPASDAPADDRGDEEVSEWPREDAGTVEATMADERVDLPPAPPRLGVRVAELEERLARLEEDFSEGGPVGAAAPAGGEAAAIEELRRAIVTQNRSSRRNYRSCGPSLTGCARTANRRKSSRP
jgi:hypothetical protein